MSMKPINALTDLSSCMVLKIQRIAHVPSTSSNSVHQHSYQSLASRAEWRLPQSSLLLAK
jgi:hypothetical protein